MADPIKKYCKNCGKELPKPKNTYQIRVVCSQACSRAYASKKKAV